MHKTPTGDHIKALRKKARRTLVKANQARKAGYNLELPEAHEEANRLEGDAAQTLKDADALTEIARLEDLQLWVMQKRSASVKATVWEYWMASWRHGSEVHNQYIGSKKRLSYSDALAKARQLKRKDLGIGTQEDR
jgi:hypothetical protein